MDIRSSKESMDEQRGRVIELREGLMSKQELVYDYNTNYKKLIHICICFYFLFFAFSPLQSIITGVLKDNGLQSLGFYCLILIYLLATLCTFTAPYFLENYQIRQNLFWGGSGYVLFFVASLLIYFMYGKTSVLILDWFLVLFFLLSGCTTGIGAGIIWGGAAHYISRISAETFRGEYFGIHILSCRIGVLSGAIVQIIFIQYIGLTTLFLLYCILGFISLYLFNKIEEIPYQQSKETQSKISLEKIKETIYQVFSKLQDKAFQKYIPSCMNQGFIDASAQVFTLVCIRIAHYNKPGQSYLDIAAKSYLCYTISSIGFNYLVNKLVDKLQSKTLVRISALFTLVSILLSYLEIKYKYYVYAYCMGFAWGIADAFQKIVNTGTLAKVFQGNNDVLCLARLITYIVMMLVLWILSLIVNQYIVYLFLIISGTLSLLMTIHSFFIK